MLKRLMVVGNPIAHSLSPRIGHYIADAMGICIEYNKMQLSADNFARELDLFFANGGDAVNITKPFKQLAYNYVVAHHSELCCEDSCNLIVAKSDDKLSGYSTDGEGFYQDLLRVFKLTNISGYNVLILGNGGVVLPLVNILCQNNVKISVLSRNNLLPYAVGSYDNLAKYDLIINTTPNTPDNSLFQLLTTHNIGKYAYDLGYTVQDSLFHDRVTHLNSNIKFANGIGMLFCIMVENFRLIYGDKFDLTLSQVDLLYNNMRGL